MENLILNRYKPITQAGAGGFGTVILAWDTRMRRKVAIKCIALRDEFADIAGQTVGIGQNKSKKTAVLGNKAKNNQQKGKLVDEAGEHWFENVPGLEEARTAAMIQDANIVTVYDFELADNTAYIIMEYVEGITLTQFLAQYSNEMTLDMLTCIFSGIAHALEVAHSENVLHLDIKPDNVLIDNKGRVKVTDFGLATLADEFGLGTADAGTIGYMPPEQMRRQALDVRTDLWALATITYEMICGQNPYDAKDIPGSLQKIEDSKLYLPSKCWENFDENTDKVLFKALSPAMEARYQSVSDFREEMSDYLSNAKAGQRQIANLFKSVDDVVVADAKKKEKTDFFEKISNNLTLTIFGRIFAILSSLFIAYFSCSNISIFVDNPGGIYVPNLWAIIVLSAIGVIGIFLPGLSFSFSVFVLSIAFIIHGNFILAGILIFLSIMWFIVCGRKGSTNTNTLACFPIFGCFGFSQFAPFVTGAFCDIKTTLFNSIFGFVLCMFLAALGSNTLLGWEPFNYAFFNSNLANYASIQNNVLDMIKNPAIWIWGASWITSAIVVNLLYNLKWRFLRFVGCSVAFIIMIAGVCFANYIVSGFISWQPQGIEILPTLLAYVLSLGLAFCLPKK